MPDASPVFTTPQQTVIYSGRTVQVRSYGCSVACRPVPTPRQCKWHALMFMRRGRVIREIRGERTLIDRNHVGFFNQGEGYTVWHPDRRGDEVTEIEILPEVLADIVAASDRDVRDAMAMPFTGTHLLIGPRAYQVHLEIWRAARRGAPPDPLAIEEAALRLVDFAVERSAAVRGVAPRPRRRRTAAAHAALAHDVKLLLSTRYREPLGLQDIASAVCASPCHLCRVFREQTGVTIHGYRNDLRLRAALGPLTDPRTSLPRLALEIGFASQSHFCDAFRRAFGRTPSAVRVGLDPAALREMSRNLEDRRVA